MAGTWRLVSPEQLTDVSMTRSVNLVLVCVKTTSASGDAYRTIHDNAVLCCLFFKLRKYLRV